jgi:hypothetical protein
MAKKQNKCFVVAIFQCRAINYEDCRYYKESIVEGEDRLCEYVTHDELDQGYCDRQAAQKNAVENRRMDDYSKRVLTV